MRTNGTVLQDEYVYYSFRPYSTNQPVDFHLSVTTGLVFLLISTNPDKPYPYLNLNVTAAWLYNQTLVPGGAYDAQPNFNFRLNTWDPRSCYARNVTVDDCIYHIAVSTIHSRRRCSSGKQSLCMRAWPALSLTSVSLLLCRVMSRSAVHVSVVVRRWHVLPADRPTR